MNVQLLAIQNMPITDEFIGENLKLPKLQGISLDHAPISESQLERIGAESRLEAYASFASWKLTPLKRLPLTSLRRTWQQLQHAECGFPN